jgi:hypothetical protein
MLIALKSYELNVNLYLETNMKKVFALIEDLWVVVAFAEAGAYESLHIQKNRLICRSLVRTRTA